MRNNGEALAIAEPPLDTQLFHGSGQGEYNAGTGAESGASMHGDNMAMVLYANNSVEPDMEPLAVVPYMKVKGATYNSDYPRFTLQPEHATPCSR